MLKIEVVDSKNIRKSTIYKIIQIILILFVLFFINLSFHPFGQDSNIDNLISNHPSTFQPIFMIMILTVVAVSMVGRARTKNPKVLGYLELDENELRYTSGGNLTNTYNLAEIEEVKFEYFSTINRNNLSGCMNYLTILKGSQKETYEIIIANSLTKSALGEILREINKKVPVRIKYSIPLKKIIRDNDFKLT